MKIIRTLMYRVFDLCDEEISWADYFVLWFICSLLITAIILLISIFK